MSKRAIVTGVTGQDGSILSEYLLDLGYDVYGFARRTSTGNLSNLKGVLDNRRFHLIYGDLKDAVFLSDLTRDIHPDEFYHLGAMSQVGHSFVIPAETIAVDAIPIFTILDTIVKSSKNTRFYFAATSELFGGLQVIESGLHEESTMNPRSPYAIAKLAGYHACRLYRNRKDGAFASSGILFNHSSTRRSRDFATRKISRGVARVRLGLDKKITMGNLSACRDEGSAHEYVRVMHLILQQDRPDDFVISTGVSVSIQRMLEFVCELAQLDWKEIVEFDESLMRPSEVPYLCGDSSKARQIFGWKATKTYREVLQEMYEHDLKVEATRNKF